MSDATTSVLIKEMPQDLWAAAKAQAAMEQKTVREYVVEALERSLSNSTVYPPKK